MRPGARFISSRVSLLSHFSLIFRAHFRLFLVRRNSLHALFRTTTVRPRFGLRPLVALVQRFTCGMLLCAERVVDTRRLTLSFRHTLSLTLTGECEDIVFG